MKNVGQSIERVEDPALLRGEGQFADDIAEPIGCCYAAFLRSPIAHADIRSIDKEKAEALPGIITVITGKDILSLTKPFISGVKVDAPQYALATDTVRYVGEPVAIVVAENRYLAEDALELIDVKYDLCQAVIDPQEAAKSDAPLLHHAVGSNILHERWFKYGDPDEAFENAYKIVETTIDYPRNSCTPIETFVVLAKYRPGDEAYDVTANFQGPYTLHPVMARSLCVEGNRLRLKTPPDSGGSFGVKQAIFPYVVAISIAAKVSGKPIKWVEDRLEHLTASTSSTNRVTTIRAALNEKGIITALDYDQLEDCGAYLRAPEPATIYRMHGNMTGAYAIQNVKIHNRVAVTNKTPTGLMRGFGGPQVYFALERLVDIAAEKMHLDPLEIRKRNLIPANAMPYKTAPGAVLDSGDYLTSVLRAEADGNLDYLKQQRDNARKSGRLYGIGYSIIVEPSISNMGYITTLLTPEEREKSGAKNGALASATVAFDPSGSVTVNVSSVPQGQGHRTVLAQVVADELGIDLKKIIVITDHDTVKDPWSIASGNYSSRFSGAVTGAAKIASERMAKRLKIIAAADLNTTPDHVELKDNVARSTINTDNIIPLNRVASKAHWSPLSIPEGAGSGLSETTFWTLPELSEPDQMDRINSSGTYGFIFDFCGVEVNPSDGSVRIDKYVTMHDAGRILNPKLADGQIKGAFAQGIGAALLEQLSYSADGAFETGTFADYCPPYATDMPELLILHDEHPSPLTPTGAKGLGEGNCMSTPVCIANAISDAIGVEVDTLPLTRPKVHKILDDEEPAPPAYMEGAKKHERNDGYSLNGKGFTVIKATPEKIWASILNPDELISLIPGCKSLITTAPLSFNAEAKIGVGPIAGNFTADFQFYDLVEHRSLLLKGTASGALGIAFGTGQITLEPNDKEVKVGYSYSMTINGKIAAVGARLLEGVVRRLIQQTINNFVYGLQDSSPKGILFKLFRWLGIRN